MVIVSVVIVSVSINWFGYDRCSGFIVVVIVVGYCCRCYSRCGMVV